MSHIKIPLLHIMMFAHFRSLNLLSAHPLSIHVHSSWLSCPLKNLVLLILFQLPTVCKSPGHSGHCLISGG
ncbi:hypothetical protein EDB19DRAFT_1770667 [Suillus lakei]|nr:hypothetical protein EDB19DRAFT_1770667 [Suillus lakei]